VAPSGVPKAKCPQCGNIVTHAAGFDPVCPRCGFRGAAPAPVPAPRPGASPPGASPLSAPRPSYGFSEPPSDMPQQGAGSGANGMAIASLICGCAGFLVGLTAPIAIILGIIALNQKPDSGGRVMAIIGIVLGAILTIGFIIMMFIFAAIFSDGFG
jgi:hypothetical protein